jgi:hypothetical protein
MCSSSNNVLGDQLKKFRAESEKAAKDETVLKAGEVIGHIPIRQILPLCRKFVQLGELPVEKIKPKYWKKNADGKPYASLSSRTFWESHGFAASTGDNWIRYKTE